MPPTDLNDLDLTLEEINQGIDIANKAQARADMFKSKEDYIIHLQAAIRGMLLFLQPPPLLPLYFSFSTNLEKSLGELEFRIKA